MAGPTGLDALMVLDLGSKFAQAHIPEGSNPLGSARSSLLDEPDMKWKSFAV